MLKQKLVFSLIYDTSTNWRNEQNVSNLKYAAKKVWVINKSDWNKNCIYRGAVFIVLISMATCEFWQIFFGFIYWKDLNNSTILQFCSPNKKLFFFCQLCFYTFLEFQTCFRSDAKKIGKNKYGLSYYAENHKLCRSLVNAFKIIFWNIGENLTECFEIAIFKTNFRWYTFNSRTTLNGRI